MHYITASVRVQLEGYIIHARSVSGQLLGSRSAWHLPVRVADLKPCARSGASTPRARTCASRCRRRPRPPRTRTEYHPVGLSASVRGAAFASGRGGHPRRGVETTQEPAPGFSTTSPCEGKGGGVPVGLHCGSHQRVAACEHERPSIAAFDIEADRLAAAASRNGAFRTPCPPRG